MNLLTDSPLKPPHTYHVSTAPNPAIQTTPLFSESSRDSIMGRLDVSTVTNLDEIKTWNNGISSHKDATDIFFLTLKD